MASTRSRVAAFHPDLVGFMGDSHSWKITELSTSRISIEPHEINPSIFFLRLVHPVVSSKMISFRPCEPLSSDTSCSVGKIGKPGRQTEGLDMGMYYGRTTWNKQQGIESLR